MNDIWDEKPPIMAQPEGSTVWLCNPKFLDWLEKIQSEWNMLYEHSMRWRYFLAYDKYSPKQVQEFKEKAEKFDKLVKLKPSQKLLEYMTELRDCEQKLEAIKRLTAPFVEWGGPYDAFYRVRLHKHPELQEYVSELMKVLYPDEQTSGGTQT